jgi:hypothetical protein
VAGLLGARSSATLLIHSQKGKFMDFLGGALPNVMFIVGMLAIGLGLGIELKLVPLNKEIDKTGRIGAMIVGAILVAGSLYIYLNPSLINRNQASPATANAALAPIVTAPTNNVPVVAIAPTTISSTAPTAANLSAEVPVPSATPAPTAIAVPTAVPPTQIRSVTVPDLHGLSDNEAQDTLRKVGLQARKVDHCSGSDQGDPKAKKHRIQCPQPLPLPGLSGLPDSSDQRQVIACALSSEPNLQPDRSLHCQPTPELSHMSARVSG